MKISHTDHDYLSYGKILQRSIYAFLVQILRLMLPFFMLSMISIYFYVFYIPKQKKNIKTWHFRNITFTVYIITKA